MNEDRQRTKEEILSSYENARKQEKADEIKSTQQTTKVKLPSNGLINPNITEVTLKRMTTMQSKTLFSNNDPNFLTTLVMSCIIEPVNITINDLHPNDIIYLIFVLRHISSPKDVIQRAVCTNYRCRHEFTYPVKIQDLKVDYADTENITTTCTLPDSGDRIKFNILSEGQLTECDKITDRKIKQQNIEYAERDWFKIISKIAYMIESKNDVPFESFDDKKAYLENLSAYDFEYFNNEYDKILTSFGLDRKMVVSCPKCDEAVEVEAYVSPEFFRLV